MSAADWGNRMLPAHAAFAAAAAWRRRPGEATTAMRKSGAMRTAIMSFAT